MGNPVLGARSALSGRANRGLGAAVLGGLIMSTVVNLVFVPCLFSLFQDLWRVLAPGVAEAEAHRPAEQPSFTQGD